MRELETARTGVRGKQVRQLRSELDRDLNNLQTPLQRQLRRLHRRRGQGHAAAGAAAALSICRESRVASEADGPARLRAAAPAPPSQRPRSRPMPGASARCSVSFVSCPIACSALDDLLGQPARLEEQHVGRILLVEARGAHGVRRRPSRSRATFDSSWKTAVMMRDPPAAPSTASTCPPGPEHDASATSTRACACRGAMAFGSPCTRPNMFAVPGTVAKSSISSLSTKPSPGTVTPLPNHALSVVVRATAFAVAVDDREVRRVRPVGAPVRRAAGRARFVGVARVELDGRALHRRPRVARAARRSGFCTKSGSPELRVARGEGATHRLGGEVHLARPSASRPRQVVALEDVRDHRHRDAAGRRRRHADDVPPAVVDTRSALRHLARYALRSSFVTSPPFSFMARASLSATGPS